MIKDAQPLRRGPTLWHPPFYELVHQRRPASFEVRWEVALSQRARLADMVLERRLDTREYDDQAQILRNLWPRLSRFTILELKTPSYGIQKSTLLQLMDYGVQFHEIHMRTLAGPSDITLVLVAPGPTSNLMYAIDHMSWELKQLGDGYAQIVGPCYTTYVVFTNQVCEVEKDEFLRLFSQHKRQSPVAGQWLCRHFRRMILENPQCTDDFTDVFERLLEILGPAELASFLTLEQRLEGLTPEQRLAGLAPEQRLAGLAPEQRLAGLTPSSLVRLQQSIGNKLNHSE